MEGRRQDYSVRRRKDLRTAREMEEACESHLQETRFILHSSRRELQGGPVPKPPWPPLHVAEAFPSELLREGKSCQSPEGFSWRLGAHLVEKLGRHFGNPLGDWARNAQRFLFPSKI